jgi:hypothetical protein
MVATWHNDAAMTKGEIHTWARGSPHPFIARIPLTFALLLPLLIALLLLLGTAPSAVSVPDHVRAEQVFDAVANEVRQRYVCVRTASTGDNEETEASEGE